MKESIKILTSIGKIYYLLILISLKLVWYAMALQVIYQQFRSTETLSARLLDLAILVGTRALLNKISLQQRLEEKDANN